MDKEKVKPEKMKAPTVWKCRSCNTQFTEREEYIAHMGEQHGKVREASPAKTYAPTKLLDTARNELIWSYYSFL